MEKIKMLSSLSNSCFGLRSFPDVVTEVIKVKNIQESIRINAFPTKYKRSYNIICNVLIEHGKHESDFKPFKLLLWALQFSRCHDRS